MRFLFLALDVNLERRAGDATHVRELASNLAALGHRVDVVVEAGSQSRLGLEQVRIHRASRRGTWPAIHTALQVSRESEVDVLYERRLTPKVGLVVSRLLGVPLVVEVNGLPDEERAIQQGRIGGPAHRRRWARRRILRRARSVVAVSEGLRRRLRDVYGIEDSRLHVIPNGVDLERFRPMNQAVARDQLGIPANARILGFAGRLTPWQGVDVLLRSLALVRREHDAIALIVGEGPDRPRLEALAASLGIQSQVRFEGAVPQELVSTYIGAFDVAFSVKPPLLSGSPLKVREYLACCRPVVASAGTEYDFHIVEEAGAGLLVDPGDIGAVAAATSSLLANDALRSEMGRRGRSYAEEHCSWVATARQVAEVCKS